MIHTSSSIPNPNKFEKYFPANFSNLSSYDKTQIESFLNTLNPLELQACLIAKNHLGTSFNIMKCNGFICWKNKC